MSALERRTVLAMPEECDERMHGVWIVMYQNQILFPI